MDTQQPLDVATPSLIDPLAPSLFHEAWWLDAAMPGHEAVTVTAGNRTVGRLPFRRHRHLGLPASILPGLVPFLGPALAPVSGSPVNQALHRHQLTRELIAQLPRLACFSQRLHRDTPDALAFQQLGFAVETIFTYEIEPAPLPLLWRAMRDKTRNVIRRAEETTTLVDLEPAAFVRLYAENLGRRGGARNTMFAANGHPVFDAALSQNRGRLLAARDKSGAIAAAIFYAWDSQVTHYILTTRHPDAHNGVVSRLIWHAIGESAAAGRVFDFGGVGTHGSVLFYTAFGGEVRPRYLVRRRTDTYRLAQLIVRRASTLRRQK